MSEGPPRSSSEVMDENGAGCPLTKDGGDEEGGDGWAALLRENSGLSVPAKSYPRSWSWENRGLAAGGMGGWRV